MADPRLTIPSLLACVIGIAAVGTLGADVRASKRDAALLKQKVAVITAHGEKPSKAAHRTTVTESEVNSYLMYEAREQIPVGVVEPSIAAVGSGRLSGRAVVDL